jgi:hypothetical protein
VEKCRVFNRQLLFQHGVKCGKVFPTAAAPRATLVVGADFGGTRFAVAYFDPRDEVAVLKFSSTFFKRWRVQGQRPWWRRFFL